jgi:hypothetical protein
VPVTEATAFGLALAFAVLSVGEVLAAALNELRARDAIRRRIAECHLASLDPSLT